MLELSHVGSRSRCVKLNYQQRCQTALTHINRRSIGEDVSQEHMLGDTAAGLDVDPDVGQSVSEGALLRGNRTPAAQLARLYALHLAPRLHKAVCLEDDSARVT